MNREVIFSIIIPCYNASDFILKAINSININQDIEYEIIVIDDGSKDDLLNKITPIKKSNPKIQYFYQHHQGVAAARNNGAYYARGQYLVFLDADDTLHHDTFSILMETLKQQPVDLVLCPKTTLKEGQLPVRDGHMIPEQNAFAHCLATGFPGWPIALKKQAFNACGRFDEQLVALEEWDLKARLLAQGAQFKWLHHPLYEYHDHCQCLSRQQGQISDKVLKSREQLYQRYFLPKVFTSIRLRWAYFHFMYELSVTLKEKGYRHWKNAIYRKLLVACPELFLFCCVKKALRMS